MKKVLTLLFLFILVFSCGNTKNSKEGEKVVTLNFISEGTSLDPQVSTDSTALNIHGLVSQGLTFTTPDGKVLPALAESWDVSEDGLTWTFHLRDGLKWSDGSELKADDFAYAWFRALSPEVSSEYAYIFFSIKNAEKYVNGEVSKEDVGIKVLDDKTLEVTLENVTPYFGSLVSFLTYMPAKQEFVEKLGTDYALEADALLYSGPYKIEKWEHNTELVLVKNEYFYNKDAIKIDKYIIKYIGDSTAALNAFKNGEIDVVEITAEQQEEFENSPLLHKVAVARTAYLAYKTEQEPFSNQKFREAISLAIDKEDLAKTVFNGTKEALYTFTPKNVGILGLEKDFSTEMGDTIEKYNPEKAKTLLKEALNELGLSELPTLTLLSDERGSNKKVAETIQENLRTNLGMNINVEVVTFKERLTRSTARNFDIVLSSWGADYQDATTFLDLLTSYSSNNTSHYNSKEYDGYIKKSLSTTDKKERVQALQQAEKMIGKDYPILPLYQDMKVYLIKENLTGLKFGAIGLEYNLIEADLK